MEKTKILEILTLATRAPSTHNSQPWLFKITDNVIEVYYNPDLFLPQADSEGRDLFISMGCMLENLSLAASNLGFKAEIVISIDDSLHKVAVIALNNISVPISLKDKLLFDTILTRVNARGIFESNLVSNDIQTALLGEVVNFKQFSIDLTLVEDKEKIKNVALLTQRAMLLAYKSIAFRKEMYHWMNSNLSSKKQGLPGYSLKMPLVVSLIIPILIRFFNVGRILGKKNLESLSSAPLISVISGPNTKETWINVGRLAERLMLRAQSQGLQTSIYVGSIEMGDLYREVQQVVNTKDRPQFMFAIGEIKGDHRVTPRHPIEKKIIT